MPSLIAAQPFTIRPPGDLLDRYPQLKRNSLALARRYAFRELVTEEMLQQMGSGLWSVLEMDEQFETARQQALPAILPILIESQDPTIQLLPWETLYHPQHDFLGKSPAFTFSRRSGPGRKPDMSLEKGPLRVLLFTSLPNDVNPETGRLNVEEEQAQVQEALARWEADGLARLEMPNDGRFSTFQASLKNFQPHLVFLSGHGRFHHEPHLDEPPYGEFLFEDESGNGDPVRDKDIARAFIGARVRAVVFSACESGMTASAELNHGLAAQVSALGIPHVIGMRESMLDRAGIQFARSLIDSLAQQERIDVALQAARLAISRPLEGIARRDAELDGLSELSLGQWCLPALQSFALEQPLIDWAFQPQPPRLALSNQSLSNIILPPRFIGRRFELRQLTDQLRQRLQLLITGPGGQGKTALAGKLAQDFQRQGYLVLAWAALPNNPWQTFSFELELTLDKSHAELYDRARPHLADEEARAGLLLRYLMEQTQNRVVLFFDNLEALQDGATHQIKDPAINAWIQAAHLQTRNGLILLLTSRWSIPGWPEPDHYPLARVSYGDFLALAQQTSLPRRFFRQRQRLRQVYQTLHGNGRGLEFFAAAVAGMDLEQEDVFLEKLAQAQVESQADMALEVIILRLGPAGRSLLERLPVFHTPAPLEGVIKIALDLLQPEIALAELLAVSLVERRYNLDWQAQEFQLSSLVIDWLERQGSAPPAAEIWARAAEYQEYLYAQERPTLEQAQITHQALLRAGRTNQAHRLALDAIVGPLNRAGFYRTLLQDWLPAMRQSTDPATRAEAIGQTGKQLLHIGDYEAALDYLQQSLAIRQQIGDKAGEGTTLNNMATAAHARGDYDTALDYLQQSLAIQRQIGDKAGEGTTLNNISQIYDARGDYDTALDYLQQSLAIRQQIGDKAGLCATLFNLGHIHTQKGEFQEAVSAWLTVYSIAKPMGLAQALQALSDLAPQIGLPPGLEGWEMLWQRAQK